MANKVIKKAMKKKNKEAAMKAMKVMQKKAAMKGMCIFEYLKEVMKRKPAMRVMRVIAMTSEGIWVVAMASWGLRCPLRYPLWPSVTVISNTTKHFAWTKHFTFCLFECVFQ